MSRRSRVVFLLLPAVALAASATAQVPVGAEFRINTYTTGNQPTASSSIAAAPNGDFVVVWEVYRTDAGFDYGDIVGQRYDGSGAPIGGEFLVNSYTTGTQWLPSVAMDASGHFVVVWNGEDGDSEGIFGQRFDASGVRRGAEFRANAATAELQFEGWVASDPAGNFLVTWEYFEAGPPLVNEVFGRLFDREGLPRGPEFRVNSYTTGSQLGAAASSDLAGNFVVVWTSTGVAGQDGSYSGVFGQRLTPTGQPVGAEFQVNTYTTGYQRYGSIASAADGRFVVTWESKGQDGSGYGVYAQRFTPSGARAGGEFRLNATTTGHQFAAQVVSDPGGNFVVAFTEEDPAGNWKDVRARRYDAGGAARGAEFRVNTYTTYSQSFPQLAADVAGNFVVAWRSYPGQDGSGSGLFGQMFGGVRPAPTTVDPGGNGVFEPGETVAIQTAWRNVSGAAQAFTGAATLFTGPGAPNSPPYTIVDGIADYGVVPDGAVGSCAATGNCYSFNIGAVLVPTVRPALHWDATFREDILPDDLGESIIRTLHVGDTFADVPRASGFYRFVEIIVHHGLTGGCGGGNFCPAQSTPREQMTVFVLLAREGATYVPPACVAGAERFADVPASSPFCRWIEELERRGIIGGCGGGNFCPLAPVSREQMAVFTLATKEPPGYAPPACAAGAERFADVPASSPFCRWIEELERRGIVGGCGGGNFCPIQAVTREQNSVFIGGTFALTLY